jgi:hypothetical protein
MFLLDSEFAWSGLWNSGASAHFYRGKMPDVVTTFALIRPAGSASDFGILKLRGLLSADGL